MKECRNCNGLGFHFERFEFGHHTETIKNACLRCKTHGVVDKYYSIDMIQLSFEDYFKSNEIKIKDIIE